MTRAGSTFYWLRIRQLADALLETQLNFVRTCPCQTEDRVRLLADKIRLLIQKLEGKCVRLAVTPMVHNTQKNSCYMWSRCNGLFYKVIIVKTLAPYWDTPW